jgi:hypothetical protein
VSARGIARRQARRILGPGRNTRLFLRQMNQESGFRDVTSPAGAQGPAQFMPATARSVGLKDPHDPRQAFGAAAKLMRSYLDKYHGSWRDALTAYNAGPGAVGGSLPGETRSYVSTILKGRGDVSGGSAAPAPWRVNLGHKTTFDTAGFEQARKRAVLGQLLARHHGTGGVLFRSGVLSTEAPDPAEFTRTALTSKIVKGAGSSSGRRNTGVTGRVIVSPGANRPGVHIAKDTHDFLRSVAGHAQQPITVGTGTNHNRLTVDGRVSDHFDGHAADIPVPVDSRQGDLIAAHALVAAGVPWKRALNMAEHGGLFTLEHNGHRVQVIWKTMQGGNHHNHVHVGYR